MHAGVFFDTPQVGMVILPHSGISSCTPILHTISEKLDDKVRNCMCIAQTRCVAKQNVLHVPKAQGTLAEFCRSSQNLAKNMENRYKEKAGPDFILTSWAQSRKA